MALSDEQLASLGLTKTPTGGPPPGFEADAAPEGEAGYADIGKAVAKSVVPGFKRQAGGLMEWALSERLQWGRPH